MENEILDFEIFEQIYNPIYNTKEQTILIEDYHNPEIWNQIKEAGKQNKVWTVVDSDNEDLVIIPGIRYINRLGYIICEKEYNNDIFEEYFY